MYRPFLEIISPAFGKLFSYTKASEFKKGLSVIPVTDHSEALRYFLLMLHHRVDKAPVENPGLIADICMVARKYEMPTIEAKMKEQLTASSVQKPLCVYAIATALGWDGVAKVAAKNTLDTPLEDVMTFIPELGRITGRDLHRLVKYRTRCAEVACEVVKNSPLHWLSLSSGGKHMAMAATVVIEKDLTACPRGSTYTNSYDWFFHVRFGSNHVLSLNFSVSDISNIVNCRKYMPQAIEEKIDKVIIHSVRVRDKEY